MIEINFDGKNEIYISQGTSSYRSGTAVNLEEVEKEDIDKLIKILNDWKKR